MCTLSWRLEGKGHPSGSLLNAVSKTLFTFVQYIFHHCLEILRDTANNTRQSKRSSCLRPCNYIHKVAIVYYTMRSSTPEYRRPIAVPFLQDERNLGPEATEKKTRQQLHLVAMRSLKNVVKLVSRIFPIQVELSSPFIHQPWCPICRSFVSRLSSNTSYVSTVIEFLKICL